MRGFFYFRNHISFMQLEVFCLLSQIEFIRFGHAEDIQAVKLTNVMDSNQLAQEEKINYYIFVDMHKEDMFLTKDGDGYGIFDLLDIVRLHQ